MKFKIKLIIDIFMLILLIMAMSYLLLGQVAHKHIGIALIVLFVAHNLLNINWYKHLFRGKYTVTRFVQTFINLATLIFMFLAGFSGLLLANLLPDIFNQFSFIARNFHLIGAYWGFILIAMHLGCHWQMVKNLIKQYIKSIYLWGILRFMVGVSVFYGIYAMLKYDFFAYLFLQNEFFFFDNKQLFISFFIDYIAIMSVWIWFSYYIYQATKRNFAKLERK